jgi:hypothetical protein
MRKIFLITAVLFLSSAWVVAQNSTPPTVPDNASPQYPSTQQQQPAAPDASQTSPVAADHAGHSLEGCIGGAAGAYTLTDASGKTYQLAGDTSKLGEHVGHSVQIWGSEEPSTTGAAASSAQSTITVKKVKMLAASCPTK